MVISQDAKTSMTSMLKLEQLQTFQSHVSSYHAICPWLYGEKQKSWEIYQALPFPKPKDETWRFSRSTKFEIAQYALPGKLDPAIEETLEERSNFISSFAGKMVFADDYTICFKSLPEELVKQGVRWKPLSEAIREDVDLLKPYLLKNYGTIGSDKFFNLHATFFREGTFLYIPKNVVIEEPLISYHWSVADQGALFPHTLVIAEEGAKANLIDVFQSENKESKAFSCGLATIIAKEGADVFYKSVQNWNQNTLSLQINDNVADKNAQLKSTSLNLGGSTARTEAKTHIQGEGAHVKMYSLTVANNEQEIDQRTYQSHEAPNTVSDLLYKNALLDNARTIFAGLIRVEPNAQKTDAYQTNRNLLLSPTAQSNSLPGLEIEANDVKCSHGATSSMINPSELFYFQSRGIKKQQAEELLVFGFFEEIIQKFENQELAEAMRDLIKTKFKR